MRAKIILVFGGSNSGKSEFAENLVMQYASQQASTKVYLATMDASASYNQATIRRHKEKRKEKGFVTVECPYDLLGAMPVIEEKGNCVILLEDLSNLLSNQCFGAEPRIEVDNMDGIERLAEKCETLVIVGNTINQDGAEYDELTLGYMQLLERQQAMVAKLADEVYEVVASVPCQVK